MHRLDGYAAWSSRKERKTTGHPADSSGAVICCCPLGNRLEPLISRRSENRNQTVALVGRVIEQDGVVRKVDGGWEILETSCIAPPDILFWHVVAARENAIFDTGQVSLDILRANVDQHNLEAALSRIEHESQIVLSGQRGFNSEALRLANMVSRRRQNLSRSRNWECCWRRRLQRFRDHVRIEYGNRSEDIRVPVGQSRLTGAVGSSDDGQSGRVQREDEED